jgi:hypothetical protein
MKYHVFEEDFSEETVKRRIKLLTIASEEEIKIAKASKKALHDSMFTSNIRKIQIIISFPVITRNKSIKIN